MMKQIGDALGQFHKISQPNFELPKFAMGIAEMEPFLKEDIPKCSVEIQNDPFIKFLYQEFEIQKALVNTSGLPKGVVHGDIFPSNIIFSHHKYQLLGIIDFEEICDSPLLLDVAMTILGCGYKGQNELILDSELVNSFLRAYNVQRTLTSLEKELLKPFIKYDMHWILAV